MQKDLPDRHHSQLRNVVKLIFGVIKVHFKILTYLWSFKKVSQVRVVAALCVLHSILNHFDNTANNQEDAEAATDIA